jgi:Zn-dependent M28 family amino/carboxypeptidase
VSPRDLAVKRIRRYRIGCAGCLLILAACAAHRPPPPSTDIDEEAFRDYVRTLASDAFEGRKPGTPGETKTVDYLVDQFRRLNLKPGNGTSYLQQVPMVEILPSSAPTLVITGHGASRALAYKTDMVIWSKRVAAAAVVKNSELVFVGYGIVAAEYGWNDYAGTDVHGKIVVVLVNDPGHVSDDPTVFKGRNMTYYGRWTYKVEEAARQGASGVLLIHDTDAASYGWDVVLSSWTGAQLDKDSVDGNAGRAAIEGWITGAAARALFAQAGLDFSSLTAGAAHPGFKPIPMGLFADAEVHDAIRRFTSPNVIAILPGNARHREDILYTAHWDHLGRAEGSNGGEIFHGAVDNASGVAGLLVLAQSFVRTRPPPDRSIVFIAFTGEESGLLGSSYYAANPVYPLSSTVADINMDALHIGGPTRDVTVIGFGQSELEGYLRDAAALQGRELHAEPKPENGDYFRSDNFSFAKVGVPALYAVGGIDDSARGPAWGQAQLDDYNAHRYHQPGDVYSPDWDLRGTVMDLRLYYRVGLRLAQTRRFPNWYSTSEFRAARERSREGLTD